MFLFQNFAFKKNWAFFKHRLFSITGPFFLGVIDLYSKNQKRTKYEKYFLFGFPG